ncbi:MAG: tetratricopeptide repeat protein, partial [Bacteroidota bacterium]
AEMSRRFFAVQKYDESLDLLDVYLKLRPDDLSSLSNKGMLLEILGRKEEARQTYESVLKKDPNNKHSKQLYENLKNNSLK